MAHTQDQIIEIISGKLFDLLHHDKWAREITCLATIDATLKALGETTSESFEYAHHSHHLAVLLATKFEHTDELVDLHEAVAHAENAVSVPDHPHRGVHLSTLIDILSMRYRWTKNLGDLSHSILYAKMAVSKTSQGDPERVRLVSKLIKLLESRFEVIDDISDLNDALYYAIQMGEEFRGPQGRSACFSRLADLSFEKHKWTDSLSDLSLAVSSAERAVDGIAGDHPDRPIYLYKLISLLFRKYSQLDHTLSLEETILYTKQAAPELWGNASLRDLLKSEILFEKLKSTRDDDKLKHALLLEIKAPEPQSPSYLHLTADILFTKFELERDLSVLEQAISKAEKAVAGTPPSHRDRITYLYKLVAFLSARLKVTKRVDDLNAVISHVEEILSESQESSDRSIHFFMLGDVLVQKFNLTKDPAVLESAIQRIRMAIVESQVGSIHRAACLSELAAILLIRFKSTKDPDDVVKATKYQEKAIKEASEGYARDVYLPGPSATPAVGSAILDDLDDSELTISHSEEAKLDDFRDSRNFTSRLPSILAKKTVPRNELNSLDTAISNAEKAVVTTRGLGKRMVAQADLATLLTKRFWMRKDRVDLRLIIYLRVNTFMYDWARTGGSSHLRLAMSIIKDLVENDLIRLPRAAVLLGLEPRQDILRTLNQAIFHPDDAVELRSTGIKRAVTPFQLLSLAIVLGSRKIPPTLDITEILSIREHSDIESVKLGRFIDSIDSVKKAYIKIHDPQIPPSQIQSTVYNHLEEATPDEDWESLQTKVFDKNTLKWTFEYKAQTFKLCDKDTIFPTAYALPETRAWLGSSKTVHIITGYQTCVSKEVMKQVAAEEIGAEEAAKKGRIFSIRYFKVAL